MHLQAGADVNLQNNLGDTPLHKAAYAGRKVRIERGKKVMLPYKSVKAMSAR